MAILPTQATTKNLIESVDITNESPRGYMGMSGLGGGCERKLWYNFHFVQPFKSHPQRIERIFNTGHIAESFIIDDLKRIGCEVFRRTPEGEKVGLTGAKEETQEGAVDSTGHIRGHYDGRILGVPEAPKTEHLLEMKTHNDKSFKDVEKKGVKASKPVHYAQMQLYMHYGELTRALYAAYNKNDSSYYFERISYDQSYAEDLVRRGQSIIMMDSPPTKQFPRTWFECKWCEYFDICHDGSDDIHKGCRTCDNVDLSMGGKWECGLNNKTRTTEEQLKGCDGHQLGWGL